MMGGSRVRFILLDCEDLVIRRTDTDEKNEAEILWPM